MYRIILLFPAHPPPSRFLLDIADTTLKNCQPTSTPGKRQYFIRPHSYINIKLHPAQVCLSQFCWKKSSGSHSTALRSVRTSKFGWFRTWVILRSPSTVSGRCWHKVWGHFHLAGSEPDPSYFMLWWARSHRYALEDVQPGLSVFHGSGFRPNNRSKKTAISARLTWC